MQAESFIFTCYIVFALRSRSFTSSRVAADVVVTVYSFVLYVFVIIIGSSNFFGMIFQDCFHYMSNKRNYSVWIYFL